MSGALDRLILGARGEPPSLLPVPLPHQIPGAPLTERFDGGSEVAPSREARSPPPSQDMHLGSTAAREALVVAVAGRTSRPRHGSGGAVTAATAGRTPRLRRGSGGTVVAVAGRTRRLRSAQEARPSPPQHDLRQNVLRRTTLPEPIREMRGAPPNDPRNPRRRERKVRFLPQPSDRGYFADEPVVEPPASPGACFTKPPTTRAPERSTVSPPSAQTSVLSPELLVARESVAAVVPAPRGSFRAPRRARNARCSTSERAAAFHGAE